MKKGLPLYQIERCFLGTNEKFGDGSHKLYVNGAYRGDTPLGKLMHDFSCTNASDMYYEMLADGTITLEKIAEFVDLSIEEVKKLKANQTI